MASTISGPMRILFVTSPLLVPVFATLILCFLPILFLFFLPFPPFAAPRNHHPWHDTTQSCKQHHNLASNVAQKEGLRWNMLQNDAFERYPQSFRCEGKQKHFLYSLLRWALRKAHLYLTPYFSAHPTLLCSKGLPDEGGTTTCTH